MALAATRQCFDKAWWISGYNLADFFFICINHSIFRGEIFSFADKPKGGVKLGSYCTTVSNFHITIPRSFMLYWHPRLRISCSRNLLAGLAGTVKEDKGGGTKGCCFPWAGSSIAALCLNMQPQGEQHSVEVSAETQQCSHVKQERGGEPGWVWCASCPCLWRTAKLSWCASWAVSVCFVQNLSSLLSLHVVLCICSWRGQRFCLSLQHLPPQKSPNPMYMNSL